MIDKRADIHPSAKIAEGVKVGPWTTIGEGAVIGKNTVIGSHVCIGDYTHLGENNTIYQFASVGSDPQHAHYDKTETYLKMGDNNIVREFVTLNRGTPEGGGETRIGSHNFLMAYTHVAHDCVVGDHVIFANTASIAGHVEVDDHVVLGAFCGVHQFCRVGSYSFLGRATKIYQDILPYMLVTGNPGAPRGLNAVGLKRNGFTSEAVRQLKKAYQIVYRQGLKQSEAREQLLAMLEQTPEMKPLIDILDASERGIARPGQQDEA